jgi:hypothetical protein
MAARGFRQLVFVGFLVGAEPRIKIRTDDHRFPNGDPFVRLDAGK